MRAGRKTFSTHHLPSSPPSGESPIGGIESESPDALLDRKEVRPGIRQQVHDKGFTSVVHFAGAIAEDGLADWFMQSTPYHTSARDGDGNITDWNQESLAPKNKLRLSLGRVSHCLPFTPT